VLYDFNMASDNFFPGEKQGTFFAFILIFSFVIGLIPVLAALFAAHPRPGSISARHGISDQEAPQAHAQEEAQEDAQEDALAATRQQEVTELA
jgi:hypothetical protein